MTDGQGDIVDLPDTPSVPGLMFRRYRGKEDLRAIVQVFEAAAREDGFDWVMTVERLENEYDNMVNFDPIENVVLAEVDGVAVGYSQVYWFEESDGTFAASHRERVVPEWRGKGLTRALLSVNEARARELAAAHARGARKMGTGVLDTEAHRTRVLEAAGWRKMRWYYEMLRDLVEPVPIHPLPDGIEVRSVEAGDRKGVFEASWEAYRGSWAFREMTDKDWSRFENGPHFQPDLWVVGWDGDLIVGSVYCWIDEEENTIHGRLWGYNDDVTVRVGYRRKGLARALLSRSLVVLRDLGMEQAILGVDTENPANALHLYRSLGYRVFREQYDLIKPLD